MTVTKDFVLQNGIKISNFYGEVGILLGNASGQKYVLRLHENAPTITRYLAERGHLLPRWNQKTHTETWVLAKSNTPDDTRILVYIETADSIDEKREAVKVVPRKWPDESFKALFLILSPWAKRLYFTINLGEQSKKFEKQDFINLLK